METNNAEEDTLFNETGNYYLNNEKLHDVQFIVGEQKEKIGAVRIMLIGQSKTWWTMLSEDSSLAEKGDIYLPDIEPEVFTLLLKHSYGGLSNLDDLSDDTVMKLCYCANKYFMKSLFEKISTRLQPKDVKDLFPALHCMVYYNLKGVEESVKKMVQTQTTKILNNPEFLECDIDSVTYICKQDSLNCDELSLWKAVVKWAKHKAQSDEGSKLRQWMSDPLQHIRLATLSGADLQDHVFGSEVLNYEEIVAICKGDVSNVSTLCCLKVLRFAEKTVVIKQNLRSDNSTTLSKSCSSIVVGSQSISLKSLLVRGKVGNLKQYFDSNLVSVDATVKITRIVNVSNASNVRNLKEESIAVVVTRTIQYYISERFTVPTLINGNGITLQANSKYKLEISFSQYLPCWTSPDCGQGHVFDHGTFFCSFDYSNGVGTSRCHIQQFTYQVAND